MSRLSVALISSLLALSAGPVSGMSVTDIVNLLDAGVGEAVILDQIEAEGARIQLGSDDLIALKHAGASDPFLQSLIAMEAEEPAEPLRDWTDAYHQPSYIRVSLYYDPFGYYWYGSPHYFAYYYPFRWSNCGFYYAGWWDNSWCGWGPTTRWYWDRYHWHGRRVHTDGRYAWNREPHGRHVTGRDASASQGRVVSRKEEPRPRAGREPIVTPNRQISREGRRTPARVERVMVPRNTARRPDRPSTAEPARPATSKPRARR